MATSTGLRLVSLTAGLVAIAATSARVIATPPQSPPAPVMQLTPITPIVLDFSASPDGGVSAGSFNNFGFTLALREPLRTRSIVRDRQTSADVVATYDYADCTRGQEALLERAVRQLPRGDAAFVDYVDLELRPFPQQDLVWDGGVCYGFRTADSQWHWRLTVTPLAPDAARDRVLARVWIKEANVDALKFVFSKTVPRHFVRTVTVATLPRR
jgi:hypothetical protein